MLEDTILYFLNRCHVTIFGDGNKRIVYAIYIFLFLQGYILNTYLLTGLKRFDAIHITRIYDILGSLFHLLQMDKLFFIY